MLTASILESLTQTMTQDASFANPAMWQSLHSDNPGTTGAHEVTTGSLGFGRQQVSFTGSGGVDTNVGAITYSINTGVTVRWIGFWTARTGGTFLGGFPCVDPYKSAVILGGTSVVICPAHGYSNGTAIRFYPLPGCQSVVPGPISSDLTYFVQAVINADSFEIVENGGITISFTGSGGLMVARDRSQTFAIGGQAIFPNTTGITYSTLSA